MMMIHNDKKQQNKHMWTCILQIHVPNKMYRDIRKRAEATLTTKAYMYTYQNIA